MKASAHYMCILQCFFCQSPNDECVKINEEVTKNGTVERNEISALFKTHSQDPFCDSVKLVLLGPCQYALIGYNSTGDPISLLKVTGLGR